MFSSQAFENAYTYFLYFLFSWGSTTGKFEISGKQWREVLGVSKACCRSLWRITKVVNVKSFQSRGQPFSFHLPFLFDSVVLWKDVSSNAIISFFFIWFNRKSSLNHLDHGIVFGRLKPILETTTSLLSKVGKITLYISKTTE